MTKKNIKAVLLTTIIFALTLSVAHARNDLLKFMVADAMQTETFQFQFLNAELK